MSAAKTNERDVFAGLDRFADNIKRNAVFVGSEAAAKVFQDEAKLNSPQSDKAHYFHGTSFKINGTKYLFEPGTLRNSIYRVMSKDNSTLGKATYQVAWNHQKCPYGFMVEYGTNGKPGVGFMRRSYDSAKADALSAAKGAMTEFLAENK